MTFTNSSQRTALSATFAMRRSGLDLTAASSNWADSRWQAVEPSALGLQTIGEHLPRPSRCGKLLVIGHQTQLRFLLKGFLEKQGYEVIEAATGNEGIELAVRHRPSAVLLDMELPDVGGIAVLKRLREWCRAPILACSESANESEVIRALDSGASDFLTVPFSHALLLARLRAAMRFAAPSESEVFQSGPLSVDLASRTVTVDNRPVSLSATEYSLLQLFVHHAGKVLTHAQIIRAVWGAKMAKNLACLRVHIGHLREKVEVDPTTPHLLLTEQSVGYRLAALPA